jgi:crotonobetainyl-CoA:carnitine CoA-transferase CaiB-like acyl-CoA transferase
VTGWLADYTVVDLTDERGLLAGQILAKLGARVIQVEPPGGSRARRIGPFDDAGRSLYWSAYAAGKDSLVLDLDDVGDRERLHTLLAAAHFVINSERPGRLAALCLDAEALRARHPSLISVSITAFGSIGPKAHWAESDLVLWAAAGALHLHRDAPGAPPLPMSVPQAWLHAGADAAAGALIAHFARLKTGRGQHVDISAQQAVTPTTLSAIAAAAVGHSNYNMFPPPARAAPREGETPQLRGPKWSVADGLVELGLGGGPGAASSNRLFAWMKSEGSLPQGLDDWDWAAVTLAAYLAGEIPEERLEIARDAVAAFLAPRTKAELLREAIDRKLLLAPINTIADLLASDHLAERRYFANFDEGGTTRTLPWFFAHGPPGMFATPRPAPALGAGLDGDAREALARPARRGQAPETSPDLRPFAGLKVLDLAWVVAGPALGRALADFGATVVRVDSSVRIETARLMGPFPGGRPDPQRGVLYDTYNTGKYGLFLDLNRSEGRAVVRDLARWADVMIESFIPGQLARWGLGPDSLRADNPGLICVSTSLMGQSGSASALSGYGNVGAAMAGFQALAGREGAPPVGPYGPYTDYIGPRFALPALLAALDHRRRTGEGCWLDVSQAEAGIQFLAPQIAETAATGRIAGTLGARRPEAAPHGVFPCADNDTWIAIVTHTDAEWARLAAAIGGLALNPAFATFAGRKAAETRLEGLIEDWTRRQDVASVEASLQAIGVPAHRAAVSADVVSDPQLIARGHFQRLPHPLGGDSLFEASRFHLSDTPARYDRPAPHFGRDNVEVLTGILGYDEARVAALDSAAVLR